MKPLVSSSVTPNQLTTVRLLCGLTAAAMIASGVQDLSRWGAVLFIVAMLFDRADGDLARMTGKTSPWGHTYDLWADTVCNAAVFVGLGLGFSEDAYSGWAPAMGWLAGISVASILVAVIRIEGVQGARAAELQGAAGFDPDDAIIIVPLCILLGFGHGLLLAAAIGAPVFALAFLWWFRVPLRGLHSPAAGPDQPG